MAEITPVLSAEQKRVRAKLKRGFEMHVLLIMDQDLVAKPEALFRAWMEGEAGLPKRLGIPPLEKLKADLGVGK